MNVVPRNGATYIKRRTMFEFLIGTRFYYKGKLIEVKENLDLPCSDCIFKPRRKDFYCKQKCDPNDRHDKKYVIFKEVE